MTMSSPSKRRYPRIPLTLEMRCPNRTKPFTFVTRDLSAGGVFIQSQSVFPLGEKIDLSCKLPYAHGDLLLKGRVVRHSQEQETGIIDGMAVEFENLSDTDRRALTQYIDSTATRTEK